MLWFTHYLLFSFFSQRTMGTFSFSVIHDFVVSGAKLDSKVGG